MRHTTYTGKVLYLTDGIGEEGREHFSISIQPDQSRTLRAVCEMDNDRLIRDVVYSLDGQWRPLECFVRLTQNEIFYGSATFRFFDDRVECNGLSSTDGPVAMVDPVPMRVPSFGAHPICCDTWHAKAADLRRGGAKTVHVPNIAMSSPLPNGGSGPATSFVDLDVDCVGEESVTTPAGTFTCKHFRNHGRRPGKPRPPVEIWAWSDDFIPVRARWELLHQTYELVELRKTEARRETGGADSLTRMNDYLARIS